MKFLYSRIFAKWKIQFSGSFWILGNMFEMQINQKSVSCRFPFLILAINQPKLTQNGWTLEKIEKNSIFQYSFLVVFHLFFFLQKKYLMLKSTPHCKVHLVVVGLTDKWGKKQNCWKDKQYLPTYRKGCHRVVTIDVLSTI